MGHHRRSWYFPKIVSQALESRAPQTHEPRLPPGNTILGKYHERRWWQKQQQQQPKKTLIFKVTEYFLKLLHIHTLIGPRHWNPGLRKLTNLGSRPGTRFWGNTMSGGGGRSSSSSSSS